MVVSRSSTPSCVYRIPGAYHSSSHNLHRPAGRTRKVRTAHVSNSPVSRGEDTWGVVPEGVKRVWDWLRNVPTCPPDSSSVASIGSSYGSSSSSTLDESTSSQPMQEDCPTQPVQEECSAQLMRDDCPPFPSEDELGERSMAVFLEQREKLMAQKVLLDEYATVNEQTSAAIEDIQRAAARKKFNAPPSGVKQKKSLEECAARRRREKSKARLMKRYKEFLEVHGAEVKEADEADMARWMSEAAERAEKRDAWHTHVAERGLLNANAMAAPPSGQVQGFTGGHPLMPLRFDPGVLSSPCGSEDSDSFSVSTLDDAPTQDPAGDLRAKLSQWERADMELAARLTEMRKERERQAQERKEDSERKAVVAKRKAEKGKERENVDERKKQEILKERREKQKQAEEARRRKEFKKREEARYLQGMLRWVDAQWRQEVDEARSDNRTQGEEERPATVNDDLELYSRLPALPAPPGSPSPFRLVHHTRILTATEIETKHRLARYDVLWFQLREHDDSQLPAVIPAQDLPWPLPKPPQRLEDFTKDAISTFVFHSLRTNGMPLTGPELTKYKRSRVQMEMLRWEPELFRSKVLPRVPLDQRNSTAHCAEIVANALDALMKEL